MTPMSEVNTLAPPQPSPEIPLGPNRATDLLASSVLRSLLVLGSADTDEPRTAAQHTYHLEELRYPGAPHEPNNKLRSDINQACLRVLEPAGIFEAVTVRNSSNRDAVAWRLTEDGRRYAVPAAVTYIDWELAFSGLSLKKDLLGDARVNQAIGRPVVTLEIFGMLIDNPLGLSFKELVDGTELEEQAVDAALKALKAKDTVLHTTKTNPAHRQLKLTTNGQEKANNTLESSAIRNTARSLYQAKHREMNAGEFLDAVMKRHPYLDRDAVWTMMTQNSLACFQFTDVDSFGPTRNYRARYQLPGKLYRPVKDLVSRHRSLQTDLDFSAAARSHGKEILTKPELVGFLLDKTNAADKDDTRAEARRSAASWVAHRLGFLTTKRVKSWRESAACQGEDTELFFPIGTKGPSVEQAEEAKSVCAECPVIQECREWSIASGQTGGIFGGMTEEERRRANRPARPIDVKTNTEITIGIQERVEQRAS
jgi:WhiB family redox-sensing transcriptional regulator